MRPQLDCGCPGVSLRRAAGVVAKTARNWIARALAGSSVARRTQLRMIAATSATGLCENLRKIHWSGAGSLTFLRIDPDPWILDRQRTSGLRTFEVARQDVEHPVMQLTGVRIGNLIGRGKGHAFGAHEAEL